MSTAPTRILLLLVATVLVAADGGERADATRTEAVEPEIPKQLSVPRELVAVATRRDAIEALDGPGHAAPDDASWVTTATPVIGVARGGEARAYPVHILEYHPVVNDILGGVPVLVSFDPITATSRAHRRKVGERTLTFGLSGLAYNGGNLLYDRETGSLWSQFEGRAVAGSFTGTQLGRLPVRQERMGTWLERHPATRVLERPQPKSIDYRYSPFKAYWLEDRIPYPVRARDERFHAKEVVLGVEVGGKTRAYLGSRLTAAGLHVEDELAGRRIRIDYDPDEAVFVWDVPDDVSVTDTYWFAWKAFHPDTELWGAPESKPSQ